MLVEGFPKKRGRWKTNPSRSRKTFIIPETWKDRFGEAKTTPSEAIIFPMRTSRSSFTGQASSPRVRQSLQVRQVPIL